MAQSFARFGFRQCGPALEPVGRGALGPTARRAATAASTSARLSSNRRRQELGLGPVTNSEAGFARFPGPAPAPPLTLRPRDAGARWPSKTCRRGIGVSRRVPKQSDDGAIPVPKETVTRAFLVERTGIELVTSGLQTAKGVQPGAWRWTQPVSVRGSAPCAMHPRIPTCTREVTTRGPRLSPERRLEVAPQLRPL